MRNALVCYLRRSLWKKESLLKDMSQLIKIFVATAVITFCLLGWSQSAAYSAEIATTSDNSHAGFLVGQLPLEVNRATGQGLIIQISINGAQPLPFLIDTGFNQTVFVEEWAAKLIHLSTPAKVDTVASHKSQISSVILKDLVLTGTSPSLSLHYSSVPAFVGNTFGGGGLGAPRMAGIIGLPLFKDFLIQLDFANHFLFAFDAKHRLQVGPDSVCLKLTAPDASNARYFATWPSTETSTVTTSLDGNGYLHSVTNTTKTTYDLLLDTGSNNSWLPLHVINSLHPLAMFVDKNFSADGWQDRTSLLVPTIGFNGLIATNLYLTPSKPQNENILGLDILRQFLVTLDFPGGQIVLNKSETLVEKGHIRGTTGVFLQQIKDSFIISRIVNDTEIQKSGLQVGSKVVQVDGQPLTELSQYIAQRLLNGEAGSDARLVIEDRQGRLKSVTLHRISQTEPLLYLALGFQLGQDDPGKVRVTNILCSSAAWGVGLRAGDEVSSVNGVVVTSLSQAENHLREWPKMNVTLTVQRQGKKRRFRLKALTSPQPTNPPIGQNADVSAH